MELETKHLAPYLPYELKIFGKEELPFIDEDGKEWERFTYKLTVNTFTSALKKGEKPILHPLSDLTKEIEHNGKRFVPINKLFGEDKENIMLMWIQGVHAVFNRCDDTWEIYQKLFEWHIDVFGLIDQGLAIDINTKK